MTKANLILMVVIVALLALGAEGITGALIQSKEDSRVTVVMRQTAGGALVRQSADSLDQIEKRKKMLVSETTNSRSEIGKVYKGLLTMEVVKGAKWRGDDVFAERLAWDLSSVDKALKNLRLVVDQFFQSENKKLSLEMIGFNWKAIWPRVEEDFFVDWDGRRLHFTRVPPAGNLGGFWIVTEEDGPKDGRIGFFADGLDLGFLERRPPTPLQWAAAKNLGKCFPEPTVQAVDYLAKQIAKTPFAPLDREKARAMLKQKAREKAPNNRWIIESQPWPQ